MSSWRWGLRLRITYYVLLGFGTSWLVMDAAIRSYNTILVPTLKRPVCAEKEPLFHRLEITLNPMNCVCLRHVASSSLVSWNKRMFVIGVVCLKRFLISLSFRHPKDPWPRPRVFWVAMVIMSPFMKGGKVLGGVSFLLIQDQKSVVGSFGGGLRGLLELKKRFHVISCHWDRPLYTAWILSILGEVRNPLISTRNGLHPKFCPLCFHFVFLKLLH